MKRAETGVQGKKYVPPSARPKKAGQNVAPKIIENKPNTNASKEKVSVANEKPAVTQATIENSPALKEKEPQKEVQDITKPAVEAKEPSELKRTPDIKVLSVSQINKQTNKKVSQEKQTNETDKSSGDHFELNELMSNILKEELNDIMDKVRGCLLDQPDTAPDMVAADMMRHKIAPHIRTAIGLNVTKRLLNVFNPMFAKIQFSCRPESGCITAFLHKYNIKNFKRIDSAKYTFAAQIDDVADFDTLCYTVGLKCGSADLKITPCYKYTQCPAKLKLNLEDDKDDETHESDNHFDSEFESVKIAKQVVEDNEKVPLNVENKENDKNNEKQTKTTAEVTKSNTTVTDSTSKNDIHEVTNSKVISITETAKASVDKENTSQNDIHEVTNSKVISITETAQESVDKENTSQNDIHEVTNSKVISITETAKASVDKENTSQNDINEVTNSKVISITETAKESVDKENTSQNDIHEVTNSKVISIPKTTKESVDKEVTSQNDKADVSPKKLSMNTFEVIDEAYEDEDEGDDANISDLLAGGVVLDECGSDD